MSTWNDITQGSTWRYRKSGSTCVVQKPPQGPWDTVTLAHQSGRVTKKRSHYFLYDFEKISEPVEQSAVAAPVRKMR